MRSLPVVEDLDVLEGLAACVRARLEGAVSDELLLEGRKETLRHRVVPAVALAAHALTNLVAPDAASESVARGLGGAVAMQDQPWLRTPQSNRGIQRVAHERRTHALGQTPANDLTRA